MTPAHPPSRWISLCAAAVVLTQLGGVAHLAAAPHGVCWEHGVVVDLDVGAAPVDGVAARPSVPGLGPAPALALRADTHPHCSALWLTRAARTDIRSSWTLGVRAAGVSRPRQPDSVPAPTGRALRSAPKQSPPV